MQISMKCGTWGTHTSVDNDSKVQIVRIYFYIPVMQGISSQKTWIFIDQLLLDVNIEKEQIPAKPWILNKAKVDILPLLHGTSPPNNMRCSLPPHISVTDVSICHNAS
jgi:hypothetical protein